MTVIGFVGMGIMGHSMTRNLLKAGYEVHGYARHPEKVKDLVEEGLILEETLADTAKAADVMISIVGYPQDVEDIYFREDGILNNLKPGSYCVDMTTSSVDLAEKIAAEAAVRNIHAMDAPVTGGDAGARNGTLTILAGGKKEDFDTLEPILKAMGSKICYQGDAGSGQSAKLVNQILIAGAMAGVAEAWAYAKSQGLDPENLYESLNTGAAGSKSLDLYWPRIIQGDMNPGFFIKHFIKDMKLALEQADKAHTHLPILEEVLKEYESLDPEKGTQALVEFYESKEAD